MVHAIAIDGVYKRYGRGPRAVHALRGVTLQIERGQVFGLLGRNGAGKTTLVKILLDVVRPSVGRTAILGVSSRDPRSRRAIGYLPEDHRFPEYLTGEQTLRFFARLSGVDPASLRSRVPALLKQVGLSAVARRKVRAYSKGMKQRLGLAQALVHDPNVLLLDEPTDGIDPVGRAEIRHMLEGLRDRGKTIFLNSHLLSEVEQICDRVAIVEDGSIVREGTVDALTRAENLYVVETDPPLGEDDLASLREVAVFVEPHRDGAEVGLRAEHDVDRIVDLLRERGIGLRGLHGKRLTLEEVFLQALGGEEASRR